MNRRRAVSLYGNTQIKGVKKMHSILLMGTFNTLIVLNAEQKGPHEPGKGLECRRRCQRATCSKDAGSMKLFRPAGDQRESTIDALLQICAVLVFRLIDHPAQGSTCCL